MRCKAQTDRGPSREIGKRAQVTAVVLFAVGDVHAAADGRQAKARRLQPGDLVNGDSIITVGNRSLCDLQIRDAAGEFVIRLSEKTRLRLSSVKFPRHKTFEVNIYRGNVLFRMNAQGEERLRVITPTAAGFVRGTSFQVKVDPNGKSTVAVHDGTVMVLPSIPAVRNVHPRVVKSSSTLTRIVDHLHKWKKVVKAGHEMTTDGAYLNGLVQSSPRLTRTLRLPAMSAVRYDGKGTPAQVKRAVAIVKKELDTPEASKEILRSFRDADPKKVLPAPTRMDAADFREGLKQYDEIVALSAKDMQSDASIRAAVQKHNKANYEKLLQSIARVMKRPIDVLKLVGGKTLRGVIIQQGRDYLVLTPNGSRLVREEELSEIRFR